MPHRNPVTGRNSGVKWSDSFSTNIYVVVIVIVVVCRLREHRRSALARNVSTPSKGNWQQRCGFVKKKVMMLTAMVEGNIVERKDPTKPAREDMGTSCAWGIKEYSSSVQFSTTRQQCRLNICSYIGWIDKYSICQFNQYNYKYWDGSAVYSDRVSL